MTPEEVPPGLKAILDQAAGRDHSAAGPVVTCLAEILTAHAAMVRAKVAAELRAEAASHRTLAARRSGDLRDGMTRHADTLERAADQIIRGGA